MKNVLISGSSGYLGSFLVKSFLQSGYRVYSLIRRRSDLHRIKGLEHQITFLFTDSDSFVKEVEKLEIDIFINAAVEYGRSNKSNLEVLEVNLIFPFRILNLITKRKGFAFITFDSFYSKIEFIENAKMPAYTLSKLQLNDWLKIQSEQDRSTILILRLEHMIGPWESTDKFNGWILEKLRNGELNINLTAGTQIRDFIYVEDIVSAVFCILKNLIVFENKLTLIEVGTGKEYTLRYFVEELHRKLNSKSVLNFGKIPIETTEIRKSKANNSILTNIGWKPLNSLEEIIEKVLAIEDKL